MYAPGLAFFWASINLVERTIGMSRRKTTATLHHLRVKVDFAKGTIGHNGICCCPFVLLIIANEVFDSGGDSLRLNALNIGCRHDPYTMGCETIMEMG